MPQAGRLISARATLAALAVLLALAPAAQAQFFHQEAELSDAVHLDEPDSATRTQLERVKALVAEKQWDEAVETLRQVLEGAGERVMAIAPGRWISLANFGQAQLAALPAEGLELYRGRVDPVARRWYEEGLAARDVSRLAAVTAQFFCSSWGDEALMALGELALERGQPHAARRYWEQIVEVPWDQIPAQDFARLREQLQLPADELQTLAHWYRRDESLSDAPYRLRRDEPLNDSDARTLIRLGYAAGLPPVRLAYPRTNLELAAVRARLVLASILSGQRQRAAAELEAMRRLHPTAKGPLAGKQVRYVDALAELLASSESWPARPATRDWPTLAGSAARNLQPAEAPDIAALAWEPIAIGERVQANLINSKVYSPRRIAENADEGLLSYHPVVAGNLLLLAGAGQVLAFDLQSGKPAWPSAASRPAGEVYAEESPVSLRGGLSGGLGVPRFTLTLHDNRLYARVGSQVTVRPIESFDHRTGWLVCLDLAAQGRLEWKIKPDDDKWAFEGAPLVEGENVYVAMRRSDVRPQAHVACFDAHSGRRRWRTLICSAETPGGGAEETTHNLLTLDEGTIYYNTNLGTVAALAAGDGRVEWISAYPRARRTSLDGQDKRAAHFYRDLNPCLVHEGLLLVAPTDSEAILAIEASTGRMLWETTVPQDAVHLLGVGQGYLLASGDRLYWIHLESGKVVRAFPEAGGNGPLGYGRGLLAGGRVCWPTRESLYLFDQRPGGPLDRAPVPLVGERRAGGGNLVLAGGHLLIAAPEKLYAFRYQPLGPPPK